MGVQTSISNVNFQGGTGITGRNPATGVIAPPTAAAPNNGNFSSPLVLGGCPISACGTEAGVFQQIFNGSGISQFVVNFINNNNAGTTVTPFGQPAGSRVQTPQTSRNLNTYGQPNNFQAPRDVRFGFRLFF